MATAKRLQPSCAKSSLSLWLAVVGVSFIWRQSTTLYALYAVEYIETRSCVSVDITRYAAGRNRPFAS